MTHRETLAGMNRSGMAWSAVVEAIDAHPLAADDPDFAELGELRDAALEAMTSLYALVETARRAAFCGSRGALDGWPSVRQRGCRGI